MSIFIKFYIAICFYVFSLVTWAFEEPWYSGPLLSDPAVVTPLGHGFFQIHAYKTTNYGSYDINGNFEELPAAKTSEIDLTFNYGITSDMEFQILLTYLYNEMELRSAGNLGDTWLTFAKQIILQNGRKWPPNIKFMFRQLFPTGHYDALDVLKLGNDATGQGSYLTTLAGNMEHVIRLGESHYLVTFATLEWTHAQKISIDGFSIYGGSPRTRGTLWPGNSLSINAAFEYCPAQYLGFILEAFILTQQASEFRGVIGPIQQRFVTEGMNKQFNANGIIRQRILFNALRPVRLNLGAPDGIGHGNSTLFSFAPAVDYSFNANVSLTLGTWFSVAGKNTPAFYAPMMAFTANW